MAGFQMQVKIDDLAVREFLKKAAAASQDLSPAMKNIGDYMLLRTAERFAGQHDPDGKSWKQLAYHTLMGGYKKTKFKQKGGLTKGFSGYLAARQILMKSGHLSQVAYKEAADSVKIGTTPPSKFYAAIQQFGGKAGRGHKVTIPARPYLGINADDAQEASRIVTEFIGLTK